MLSLKKSISLALVGLTSEVVGLTIPLYDDLIMDTENNEATSFVQTQTQTQTQVS